MKIKNEMAHIMGSEDVNDYFPGGSKNPLHPLEYYAFLKAANSSTEKPKNRRKKLKKESSTVSKQPMTVEHSHSEIELPVKLQVANSKRKP